MKRKFNETKATQAAAKFLQRAGGTLNYMILIKLLYLLDRKALLHWGRSVTFSDCYSMEYGPVVSEVHDLITEQQRKKGFWQSHIAPPQGYSVSLQENPGDGALSEAEEDFITEVFSEYGHYTDPFKLADLLHQELPEWTPVEQGERVKLSYKDIWIKAGNIDPKQADELQSELDSLLSDYVALGVS